MSDSAVTLPAHVDALNWLNVPVWLVHRGRGRVSWRNHIAQQLTVTGDSADEALVQRILQAPVLPVTFALGTSPVLAVCTVRSLAPEYPDLLIVEGRADRRADAGTRRSVEAVRSIPVMISEYDAQTLELLNANPAAAAALDRRARSLSTLFADSDAVPALVEALHHNDRQTLQAQVHTITGTRWHNVDLRLSPDPVSGRHMIVVSQVDVTERREMEALKDRFIATVSHELRTPLTTLSGALSLMTHLDEDDTPNPARHRLMSMALRNCGRLQELVENLLDIQLAEADALPISFQPVLVGPLVAETVAGRDGFARHHGVSYQVEVNASRQTQVLGDRDRLRQALDQLLSNAAKFTRRGDRIQVAVNRQPDWVIIQVTDHGPGVPANFESEIFSRFSQADSSSTRRHNGIGLGLCLTRAITERHGGYVRFDSSPNEETRFQLWLPALASNDAIAAH